MSFCRHELQSKLNMQGKKDYYRTKLTAWLSRFGRNGRIILRKRVLSTSILSNRSFWNRSGYERHWENREDCSYSGIFVRPVVAPNVRWAHDSGKRDGNLSGSLYC